MAVISKNVCLLEVRARLKRGESLSLTVNGLPCEVRKLGHNIAQELGAHPYAVITQVEYPPSGTFTLEHNAALTAVRLAPFGYPILIEVP